MATNYKGNKFKNAVGAHYLQALFFETSIDFKNRESVLYTLKQEDHEGYPSLHRLYIEMKDVSEYEFAKTYFDNWSHWKKLLECSWFKPYLEEMREELDVSLKAEAINKIRLTASNPNDKNYYNANRFIENKGLAIKKDNRGRPSKEKIRSEADKLFKAVGEVDEDYERITGQVN